MTNLADELYDSMPDRCPGCGKFDGKLDDGPSSLMLLWSQFLNSYLCIDCNRTYTEWISKQWEPEYRERNTPKAMRNIEAIAAGKDPNYDQWTSTHTHP